MDANRKLEVNAIENGTVIDQIPADSLFKVISILDLHHCTSLITFGTNFESKKLGKKAIIKLSDTYFIANDINKIALVAPEAKLNLIKNYKVVEKTIVKIPNEIIGIARCMNPKCVSNFEKITTKFKVLTENGIALKCHYCEKITNQEHIQII